MTTSSRISTPLGRKVRELREWSGLSIGAVATAIKCSVGYISDIERGKVRASSEIRARLADVLDCEVEELDELAAWHKAPSQCNTSCDHDGMMARGGNPSDMRETCVHYTICLANLAIYWPEATNGHCPPTCRCFVETPRDVRVQRDGGQNGDRRYDDAESLGNINLPLQKKRLPLARHSGTQTAQLCTCSKCESIRGRKSA